MPAKKNPEAQRRVKDEADERSAWRRESQLAEEAELAREEQRWHPKQAPKQQAKTQRPSQEGNKPSEPSGTYARKSSRPEPKSNLLKGLAPGDNPIAKSASAKGKPSAEPPSFQGSVPAFENVVGIVQDVKRRISHPAVDNSLASTHKSRGERQVTEQDVIHQELNRVVDIVHNAIHDTAQHDRPVTSSTDAQASAPSPKDHGEAPTTAPRPAREDSAGGSATIALLRAIDTVNKIVNPPQSLAGEGGERSSHVRGATVPGLSHNEDEPHREPEASPVPPENSIPRTKSKEERKSLRAEKKRVKKENKYAKKERKARKKEERAQEHRDKFRSLKEKYRKKSTTSSAAAADSSAGPS